jgi:Patatin-like phospholipase
MLQALYERDIRPDLFVGTSAGALNAAFAAGRPSTVDTAIELQRIWLGLTRSQVFPASPLTAALGVFGVRDHSFPPSGLQRVIDVELGADRVFVLSAMRPSRLGEAPRGAVAAGITAITRVITRRLEEDIARDGGIVDLTVLPAPTLRGLLPTDFGHADELIEQGLHRARAELRRHHAPARSLRRAA